MKNSQKILIQNASSQVIFQPFFEEYNQNAKGYKAYLSIYDALTSNNINEAIKLFTDKVESKEIEKDKLCYTLSILIEHYLLGELESCCQKHASSNFTYNHIIKLKLSQHDLIRGLTTIIKEEINHNQKELIDLCDGYIEILDQDIIKKQQTTKFLNSSSHIANLQEEINHLLTTETNQKYKKQSKQLKVKEKEVFDLTTQLEEVEKVRKKLSTEDIPDLQQKLAQERAINDKFKREERKFELKFKDAEQKLKLLEPEAQKIKELEQKLADISNKAQLDQTKIKKLKASAQESEQRLKEAELESTKHADILAKIKAEKEQLVIELNTQGEELNDLRKENTALKNRKYLMQQFKTSEDSDNELTSWSVNRHKLKTAGKLSKTNSYDSGTEVDYRNDNKSIFTRVHAAQHDTIKHLFGTAQMKVLKKESRRNVSKWLATELEKVDKFNLVFYLHQKMKKHLLDQLLCKELIQ